MKSQKCLRNFRDIQAETPFTHTLKTDICVNIFICIILIYVRVFRQRKAVIKTISELFKWSYKVFLTFFYNFSQLFLRLHVYRVSLRSTYLCLPLSVKSQYLLAASKINLLIIYLLTTLKSNQLARSSCVYSIYTLLSTHRPARKPLHFGATLSSLQHNQQNQELPICWVAAGKQAQK